MLVNYFVILSTLLLLSGLALDTGLLEWRALHIQNAADAAALEAMYEKARNDASWSSAGQAQATKNYFTNGANGVTVAVSNPPASGVNAGNALSFQATVSQSVSNLFMGLVNGGKSTVAATAVAKILPTCIWIMNPNSGTNSSLWLASAGMYPSCGVSVNTTTGYNLQVDGFAALYASRIRVTGPSTSNLSTGRIGPSPRFSASVKTDPLAYITAPIFTSCNVTATAIQNTTATAYPGTYCGGMAMTNSTVYLNPGLYIIAGGLSMTNSYLYGLGGVTLYFTKGGGYGYGSVNITSSTYGGNSGIYLKAPTNTSNGGIPGVVIFADRAWVTHGSQQFSILFTQITTDGVWYLPNTGLYLWQAPFNYYKYAGLVVDNIYQYGASSYFGADYSDFSGVSPYHYEDGVLVQ